MYPWPRRRSRRDELTPLTLPVYPPSMATLRPLSSTITSFDFRAAVMRAPSSPARETPFSPALWKDCTRRLARRPLITIW